MEKTLCMDKGSPEESTKQDSGIQMESPPSQISSLASNDSTENGEEVSENETASSKRRRTYDQSSLSTPSNSGASAKMIRTEKGAGNLDQIFDHVALQRKSVNTEVPNVQMGIKQMDRSIVSGGDTKYTCINIYGVENKIEKLEEQKESEEQLAIEQVKQYQAKHKEREVTYPKSDSNQETIPQVNPVMRKVRFYQTEDDDDRVYDPKHRDKEDNGFGASIETIEFNDLLEWQEKFIALVGRPGCGKTTCSKRLFNNSEKFCIWLRLSEIGSKDRTLRELILDKNYSNLDRKICENAFDWIKKHQEDCTLILDGFDQLPWSFEDVAVEQGSCDEAMHPKQLITNLCGRKFLPDIRLVLTSRPFALIPLPDDLRPDATIRLQDLSTKDMEKLFRYFCGDEADSLLKNLNAQAPLLLDLCHNPLMLTFLASITKSSRHSRVTRIRNMTDMFEKLLRQLRRTRHWHSKAADHQKLFKKLGSLAYRATKKSALIFYPDDLKRENLELKDVQDLMFSVADYEYENEKLFETEDTKLYFVHQTWQEFFAAYYLCHCMDWEQFQESMEDIVLKANWLMVRRFLCGLLTSPAGKDVKRKHEFFFQKLEEHFEMLSERGHHSELLDMMQDLLECGEKMIERFAVLFPDKATFHDTELRPSAAHALGKMISSVPEPLTTLDLHNCYPNHESLKKICDGLAEMNRKHKQKIKRLDLSFNRFKSEVVETLCKVIPHVERILFLCGAFDYGDGMRQPNGADLEQLINARVNCGNQDLKISPYSSRYE